MTTVVSVVLVETLGCVDVDEVVLGKARDFRKIPVNAFTNPVILARTVVEFFPFLVATDVNRPILGEDEEESVLPC